MAEKNEFHKTFHATEIAVSSAILLQCTPCTKLILNPIFFPVTTNSSTSSLSKYSYSCAFTGLKGENSFFCVGK